ncbi:MAG: glycosyltransferase family 4 protein [Candidatus Thorarchaeota archaeon]|jgi:glycosyltransferase involved in cell wall biosynthesis
MKVLFDFRQVGMGNNGGTSTIVRSANQLVEMGHEVTILDSSRNQFTWCPLFAKHIRPKKNNHVPDADVVIATGYKSVGPTIRLPERCGIKSHWIRAWETWVMPEEKIVGKIMNQPTVKLVNSICLHKKLKEHGLDSYIIRPGYDLDLLYPMSIHTPNNIVLGGLFRTGVHGKRKRTEWIFNAVREIKKKYDVMLWMFGSEANPNNPLIDRYLRLPNMKEKSKFYNSIDIWLAPTMSEGLHMPPAEVMLVECPVVGTNAELSGMQDYLIHGETGYVSQNNLKDFIKYIEKLIENPFLREDFGRRGRKRILEIGDRKKNMQKLVDLFTYLKEKQNGSKGEN